MISCINFTKRDLEDAKDAANQSNVRRAKHSAIAMTKSGRVIATAYNRRVDGFDSKFTEHAEEGLINKLNRLKAFDRFGKLHIVVIRITTKGLSMSKPCPDCEQLLNSHNCEVYYTDENGTIQKMKSN